MHAFEHDPRDHDNRERVRTFVACTPMDDLPGCWQDALVGLQRRETWCEPRGHEDVVDADGASNMDWLRESGCCDRALRDGFSWGRGYG